MASSVRVYAGPGTGARGVLSVIEAVRETVGSAYRVTEILPDELIAGGWETSTALLIIPGGADLPYCAVLNGRGTERIKQFVNDGGAYLGICAGAYFGSAHCEFAKGTELEVVGTRELAFHPGTARGPVLKPYTYNSEAGACLAPLRLVPEGTLVYSYFNGGCELTDVPEEAPEGFRGGKTLAVYQLIGREGNPVHKIAACACKWGEGVAVLSGVHAELDYSWLQEDANDDVRTLCLGLRSTDSRRRVLWVSLLKACGLNCDQPAKRPYLTIWNVSIILLPALAAALVPGALRHWLSIVLSIMLMLVVSRIQLPRASSPAVITLHSLGAVLASIWHGPVYGTAGVALYIIGSLAMGLPIYQELPLVAGVSAKRLPWRFAGFVYGMVPCAYVTAQWLHYWCRAAECKTTWQTSTAVLLSSYAGHLSMLLFALVWFCALAGFRRMPSKNALAPVASSAIAKSLLAALLLAGLNRLSLLRTLCTWSHGCSWLQ
eukprot:jgi/Chlat1/115/Chrsp1S03216